MKNFFKNRVAIKLLQISACLLTLASAAFFAAPSAPVSAWGPERPSFTNENPASYVTFNSITNNAAIGDEFNFVRIGKANSDEKYIDTLEIVPGEEYEVYVYYHNNASGSLNASGKGIANGVRISSAYPTTVKKGEKGMVSGIVSASDAVPTSVWDEAYFVTNSDEEITLRYKTGTAIIHNAGRVNGSILSDNLFTEEGVYIGINTLDGRIPGCAEYSGYITYTLIAEKTETSLNKQVSTDGENWAESVTVKPGEYVTYRVTFKNDGNTNLTNAIFKDIHDENLILRAGTTKVYDVNNINGKTIDDILDLSGYNVGDVAPGALVQIVYQSQVKNDTSLCGKTLANKISLDYNSTYQKSDDASVTVACDSTPVTPGPTEETCATNPNLEGCQRIPSTGPLEIVMAVIVVLGIAAGGFYLYRTKHTLKTVENDIKGDTKTSSASQIDETNTKESSKPEAE